MRNACTCNHCQSTACKRLVDRHCKHCKYSFMHHPACVTKHLCQTLTVCTQEVSPPHTHTDLSPREVDTANIRCQTSSQRLEVLLSLLVQGPVKIVSLNVTSGGCLGSPRALPSPPARYFLQSGNHLLLRSILLSKGPTDRPNSFACIKFFNL